MPASSLTGPKRELSPAQPTADDQPAALEGFDAGAAARLAAKKAAKKRRRRGY